MQPVVITTHRLGSLTTCVAKAMEHMIHNRLYYLVDARGWLSLSRPASEPVTPVDTKFCE